jgi:hypothetical protein
LGISAPSDFLKGISASSGFWLFKPLVIFGYFSPYWFLGVSTPSDCWVFLPTVIVGYFGPNDCWVFLPLVIVGYFCC